MILELAIIVTAVAAFLSLVHDVTNTVWHRHQRQIDAGLLSRLREDEARIEEIEEEIEESQLAWGKQVPLLKGPEK